MNRTEPKDYFLDWDTVGLEQVKKTPSAVEHYSLNPLCNRQLAIKGAIMALSSLTFGASTYTLVDESLGSRNIKNLAIAAFFNGVSITPFFHMLFNSTEREKLQRFSCEWTYELILFFTQFYLNFTTSENEKEFSLPFIWFLGLLQKDLLYMLSMSDADLSLRSVPPKEEELLQTMGFTTRDYSIKAKCWLAGLAVTAVALTTLNFVVRDEYPNLGKWGGIDFGDLGKIGMLQDICATISGSIVGDFLARFLDDWKERKEIKIDDQLLTYQRIPGSVKAMRVAKNFFVLFSPITIGALLSISTAPNSLADYFTKLGVGGVYGINQLLLRREFENPVAQFHTSSMIEESGVNRTAREKVMQVAKKYFASGTFFAAVISYMGVAAATNTSSVGYAVIVLLLSMTSFFGLTNLLASCYQSQENNRFKNELCFRLLFGALMLSIFYQYLTTKLNISDQYLNRDSNTLYVLSLVTWFFWGMVVGNNRACSIQSRFRPAILMTPPIATQELSKTFGSLLSNPLKFR